MDTQVVILDEPTIAQDDCGKNCIESVIKHLVLQGKTVIAVLHDMNFVARVFNRVVVLSRGKVLFDGTTRDSFMQDNILSAHNSISQILLSCAKKWVIKTHSYLLKNL